ncbi:hypothetical protein BFG06_21630 [Aeromonas caviae]|nr:hypothetical protein BFG06_21630 [Aeromonas caviae]
MTGNASFSKITDHEKNHTLSLDEFLEFANESKFNKWFRPNPKAKVLNRDFHVFDELFLGNNTAPKHIRIDGYKATDLIFKHPKGNPRLRRPYLLIELKCHQNTSNIK